MNEPPSFWDDEARNRPPPSGLPDLSPPAAPTGPPPPNPLDPPIVPSIRPSLLETVPRRVRDYFLGTDPGFWQAMVPLMFLSVILFTRLPTTNYIFDEQEALLANPYVNATGGLRFIDAIHRDFWGLPADRSVGSYRPIPNFLWRLLWHISKQPFFHHFYNVLFHAANGAILVCIAYAMTRRRGLAWLAGVSFVACAVLTEAVSGIVGIADVLGGMGALLALLALRLPGWVMPFGVFASLLFGLFCKESALVCVPLVPFAALIAAPLLHPERPARFTRALLALAASVAAFVLYVELRKRWFLSPLPAELSEDLPPEATRLKHIARDFLVWFHQAPLPKDPLNNPLAEADTPHRIAGALRVYWRGLGQIVFPKTLSGDYSFPQEPIPDRTVFPESVAGAAMTVVPPLAAIVLWMVAMVREGRARARASLILQPAAEEGGAVFAPPPAGTPHSSHSAGTPRSPGKSSYARGLRPIGAALFGVAMGSAVLDYFVLRPRLIFVTLTVLSRPIPLPLLLAPIGLVGLGLMAEGGLAVRRIVPEGAAVPLRIAGPVLVAIGFVWVVVSYFPHSNIPVVLPTVRAERFWYFPAIGSSLVLAVLFDWAAEGRRSERVLWTARGLVLAFFGFQCIQAYRHAMDYRDDVVFWEATKNAVPNSAKAHLNYSVMKGARGDLTTRLTESKIALELAPKWPMAHVYTGDTLCRMHYAERAWPYYKKGFEVGPNELSLIALALQCLHDEGKLTPYADELRALADQNPGSWIAYLAVDTLDNHEKNKGVDPKYRPRGYNEGPRDSE